MSLRTLKALARKSATLHGHTLARFQSNGIPAAEINAVTATCSQCGQQVTVTPRPRPNETPIAGEAVALHCKGGA